MSTAQLLPSAKTEPSGAAAAPAEAARISFRQPVSSAGFIDAAWWPRSLDLTTELPPLLEMLRAAAREINRITFNTATPNLRRISQSCSCSSPETRHS